MPYDIDLEGRFPLEQLRDFLEGGVGFGLDVGFAGVEEDAVDDNVTDAGDAGREVSGVLESIQFAMKDGKVYKQTP
jgi:hypothetical protein